MSDYDNELQITREEDIIAARGEIRKICTDQLKFSTMDRMMIITATSELARNICKYAVKGTIHISIIQSSQNKHGIKLIFKDSGPGIANLDEAMKPRDICNYQKGMGVGLAGSKKLADEFDIKTAAGKGTVVTWIKYER